jgi:hypothetical protein
MVGSSFSPADRLTKDADAALSVQPWYFGAGFVVFVGQAKSQHIDNYTGIFALLNWNHCHLDCINFASWCYHRLEL